jgi:polyisoprenoid-binding protein YceI
MRLIAHAARAAFALTVFASIASAAPQTFVIDRSHSEVGFNVRHFFSRVHGSFADFSGSITYDPEKLAASSVEVTIRDSSIYTANERRDNHLRSEDFFWTEKHPLITFKSTKVLPGADAEHFQVAGDLTIRDVTKPVTLDVEMLGIGQPTMEGRDMGTRAGFEATTRINRKDYGIVWNKTIDQGGAMLSDDVDIVLNVEAFTRPPASAQGQGKPPVKVDEKTAAKPDGGKEKTAAKPEGKGKQ